MTIITYVAGADDAVMWTDIFQLSAFLPIKIINPDQVCSPGSTALCCSSRETETPKYRSGSLHRKMVSVMKLCYQIVNFEQGSSSAEKPI